MSGFHVERKLDRSSQPRKVAASPGTGRPVGNWMRCSDVITGLVYPENQYTAVPGTSRHLWINIRPVSAKYMIFYLNYLS